MGDGDCVVKLGAVLGRGLCLFSIADGRNELPQT